MPRFLGMNAETAGYAQVACVSCAQFMPRSDPSIRPSVGLCTPPTLRWLRNQRAAIAGDIEYAESRAATLNERIDQLTDQLSLAQSEFSGLQELASIRAAQHAALLKTIELEDACLKPMDDGAVRAWAGRYGERGALTVFVRDHLRMIAPRSMRGIEITRLTAAHFGIAMLTREDRIKHSNTVRTTLRRLRDMHGVLECVPGFRGKLPQPRWRWKPESTLAELHKLAMAVGVGVTHDGTHPHAVRGEVAS